VWVLEGAIDVVARSNDTETFSIARSIGAASSLRVDMISGKDRYTKAVRHTSGKLRALTYR